MSGQKEGTKNYTPDRGGEISLSQTDREDSASSQDENMASTDEDMYKEVEERLIFHTYICL
jgi:hypothetical protein